MKKLKRLNRSIPILKRLSNTVELNCVEVGVRLARNAACLLSRRKLLHLTLIDPWIKQPADSSYGKSKDGLLKLSEEDWEIEYSKAMRHLEFAKDRITVHRMLSHQAAPLIKDHSQDLVFIDADHSYEGCALDIKLFLPKVKPGGWLCGHDFKCWKDGKQRRNWGVDKAVKEVFYEANIELDKGDTWFVRLL